MADNIAFGFLNIGFPDDMTVFIVSSMPFLGLRAGILLSVFMGFGVIRTLVVCVAGSLMPAPFILIFFNKLLDSLERRRSLASMIRRVRRAILRRSRHARERLALGLFIFSALPLPLTGVWAASIIASSLGLDAKMSMLAIGAGTFAGAIIYLLLTLTFPALFWI